MTNKNIHIRPSVALVDGQLIETYERVTNARAEDIEALGYESSEEHYAQIGTAPITEYVRLIAKNLSAGSRQFWSLNNIGQTLEIDNIYIDSPNSDSFDLEVYDQNGEKPLDLTIRRNQAPYDLPNAVLTTDLKLAIFARNYIKTVIVICRPAVLLADYLSDEIQAQLGQGVTK